MTLTVAIFSYNRGAYLAHCVASVRRNMPWASVAVYDDASDDPETQAILRDLPVPVQSPAVADKGRHGGLYANMQTALDQATTRYLMFLQEDMQIVRPVDAADLATLDRLFDADPARAFTCPLFMKGRRLRRHQRLQTPDAALRCYRHPADATAKATARRLAYYDVSLADVARLRAAQWAFQPSERANVAQARRLFSDMPMLGDPFAFFCPEVPIFRNRAQSLASRLAARVTGPDVKGIVDMTADGVASLRARALTDWPEAERYLAARDPRVRKPFVYKDVKARWWLNLLYRAERLWRK
jgi:glycosyltransferase involved in cell wall biosynthesis